MKRYGFLYKKICSIENCKLAILEAAQSKKKRRRVKRILDDVDRYAEKLSEMLRNHEYSPNPYSVRYINDGIKEKRRRLARPNFWPDQCVHKALDRVMAPIFTKKLYPYCTGSIKGRGGQCSKRGLELFRKRHPDKAKYVYKSDVHHCYDSIPHDRLKASLRRLVKDKEVLWLFDLIIDSYPKLARVKGEEPMPEDKGIPIGIDPARWLCNFYLSDLEWRAKRFLGKDYFITRYVDDTVISGPNKRRIHRVAVLFAGWLKEKCLEVKRNWQVFRWASRPIDFLGFKFYKDKTTIRKTILKRIKRKLQKTKEGPKIAYRIATGLMSYVGYLKNSNSQYFREEYIDKQDISLKKVRKVVSHYERTIQRAA